MVNLTLLMIIWRVFLSFAWGFFIAVSGWLVTLFLVKAVNTSFRPKPIHHLVCFFVALITFVVFQFISATTTGLQYIDQASSVIKTELADNQYLQQQFRSIANQVDQKGKVSSKSDISEFVVGVNDAIKQKYPILSRVVHLDGLEKNKNFQARLTKSFQESGKNNITILIETFADQYSYNLRKPLVRTRLILIVLLIGIQLTQIILMMINANKSSAPVFTDAYDSSTDY